MARAAKPTLYKRNSCSQPATITITNQTILGVVATSPGSSSTIDFPKITAYQHP
jgi:hypothetical protein